MLPVFFMPEKDEDMSSYLNRLLEGNGIFNATAFFRRVSKRSIVESRSARYPLGLLFGMIEEQERIVDIFLETTNYDLESIFMPSAEQAFYLSKAFASPEVVRCYCGLFLGKSYISCPICKHEVEIGKAVSKKIFKSSLYHACPYHLYNFSNPLLTDIYIEEAKYIKAIQDFRPDLNAEELYSLIGYIDLPKKRKTDYEILSLIMIAYPDVEDFFDALPYQDAQFEPDSEYEMLSSPKRNITGFRHIPCGTLFCMNVSGFNAGIRCPKCQGKSYSLKEIEKAFYEETRGIIDQTINLYIAIHDEHLKTGKKITPEFVSKVSERYFGGLKPLLKMMDYGANQEKINQIIDKAKYERNMEINAIQQKQVIEKILVSQDDNEKIRLAISAINRCFDYSEEKLFSVAKKILLKDNTLTIDELTKKMVKAMAQTKASLSDDELNSLLEI